MLDDHRIESFRLRRVPGILGCIELGGQGGAKLLSSDQPLQLLTR